MNLLTRDQILHAQDLKPESVHVPEWNGDVLIQPGTGDERDAFEGSIISGKGEDREVNTKRLRVKLLAMALVDETGMRIFSEFDLDGLAKKSARVIDRLFRVAQRAWGLSKEDVDELTKNLRPAPSGGPGTGSPANGDEPPAN